MSNHKFYDTISVPIYIEIYSLQFLENFKNDYFNLINTDLFLVLVCFCFSKYTVIHLTQLNTNPIQIAYDDVVELEQGLVRGHLLLTPSNTSFRAFQGIPYAEPPLGELRFQVLFCSLLIIL